MDVRTTLEGVATLVLVVAVAAVILGGILGQPVLLSFVETGSMQPALAPGDGFVAIPKPIAGPIETGDVVVYDAESLNGGGLVTHRVVGATDRGYVTKGDANAFTDQSDDEPPVKEVQVVAVALQIGGGLVVVPSLGVFVGGVQGLLAVVQRWLAGLLGTSSLLGVQGLAYLFFAVTVAWYAVGTWRERGRRSRRRERSRRTGYRARLILAGFAAIIVIAATASMVAPAGTQRYGIVSAEFDSPGARVIPAGESETATYPTGNGGFVPVVVFLEPASEGIDVHPRELRIGPRSVENSTLTLSAPPETGFYRRYLVEHRYLAVLPVPVIRSLYGFHPWAPIVVIDALLGLSFYLLGAVVLDTRRVRVRVRKKPRSARTRLRRAVRKLY